MDEGYQNIYVINARLDEGPHRPDRGRRLEPVVERGAGLGDGAGVLPPLQAEARHPRPFPECVIMLVVVFPTSFHKIHYIICRSHGDRQGHHHRPGREVRDDLLLQEPLLPRDHHRRREGPGAPEQDKEAQLDLHQGAQLRHQREKPG